MRDNKCAPGDVKKYVMQELNKGASKTYLLSSLVRGMEGDDGPTSDLGERSAPVQNNDETNADQFVEPQIRFADTPDASSSDVEDKNEHLFYSNHISASMKDENDAGFC